MAIYQWDSIKEIDTSVIWVSVTELRERTGVPRSTFYNHVKHDWLDMYSFRNRGFIHPDAAAKYEELVKSGILGRNQ